MRKKPTLLKSFVYLINDVTNILLEKERIKEEEHSKNLRKVLSFVTFLLIVFIILSIYLIYIK